jgi:exodeoxyribonuclease VII large subunit
VARAIFASEIPVISAVGHEPDVTIADFVADLRAATPSNAAELAVPDKAELMKHLDGQKQRLSRILEQRLLLNRTRRNRCKEARALIDPLYYIQDKRQLVDYTRDRMLRCAESVFGARRRRFGELAASLDALSPLKVLGRGYSIVYAGEGLVVKSWKDAVPGDTLRIRLEEGSLLGTVDACIPAERKATNGKE